MKDKKDWGPADYVANTQIQMVGIVGGLLVLYFIICGADWLWQRIAGILG